MLLEKNIIDINWAHNSPAGLSDKCHKINGKYFKICYNQSLSKSAH